MEAANIMHTIKKCLSNKVPWMTEITVYWARRESVCTISVLQGLFQTWTQSFQCSSCREVSFDADTLSGNMSWQCLASGYNVSNVLPAVQSAFMLMCEEAVCPDGALLQRGSTVLSQQALNAALGLSDEGGKGQGIHSKWRQLFTKGNQMKGTCNKSLTEKQEQGCTEWLTTYTVIQTWWMIQVTSLTKAFLQQYYIKA